MLEPKSGPDGKYDRIFKFNNPKENIPLRCIVRFSSKVKSLSILRVEFRCCGLNREWVQNPMDFSKPTTQRISVMIPYIVPFCLKFERLAVRFAPLPFFSKKIFHRNRNLHVVIWRSSYLTSIQLLTEKIKGSYFYTLHLSFPIWQFVEGDAKCDRMLFWTFFTERRYSFS